MSKVIRAAFDWDEGNRDKCQKHGVTVPEIESVFTGNPAVRPDTAHSGSERRFRAIGKAASGRFVFLAFALRKSVGGQLIRPISARYMHLKEIQHYERQF